MNLNVGYQITEEYNKLQITDEEQKQYLLLLAKQFQSKFFRLKNKS